VGKERYCCWAVLSLIEVDSFSGDELQGAGRYNHRWDTFLLAAGELIFVPGHYISSWKPLLPAESTVGCILPMLGALILVAGCLYSLWAPYFSAGCDFWVHFITAGCISLLLSAVCHCKEGISDLFSACYSLNTPRKFRDSPQKYLYQVP
jgi:hypothetical protein